MVHWILDFSSSIKVHTQNQVIFLVVFQENNNQEKWIFQTIWYIWCYFWRSVIQRKRNIWIWTHICVYMRANKKLFICQLEYIIYKKDQPYQINFSRNPFSFKFNTVSLASAQWSYNVVRKWKATLIRNFLYLTSYLWWKMHFDIRGKI